MSLRKYDILYYIPSTPMGIGVGRDAQPYLYNSKEFVQDHGLNTYDYGFRGYYTVIGRFTTPDPLAEQTPWLSPYSYAGNNFINAIDWMGLSGMTATTNNLIVVNSEEEIVYVDWGHWDQGVYQVDDSWDGTYWDLLQFKIIGDHKGIGPNSGWVKGTNIKGLYNSGDGYYNEKLGCWVAHGTIPRNESDLLVRIFNVDNSLVRDAIIGLSGDVFEGFIINYLYNQNIKFGQTARFLSAASVSVMKKAITGLTYINAGVIGYNMLCNGVNVQNISDAVALALSTYLADVAINSGINGLASVLGSGATISFGLGALAGEAYILGNFLSEVVNSINVNYGNLEWMGEYYK